MAIEYSFADRLQFSKAAPIVPEILLREIPGAVAVHAADKSNDRLGTDYWVEHARGTHLSVDVKLRTADYAAKPEPDRADDLALETWSVVEKQKIGWTRDASKRMDYVLWLWRDTHRWCLLPFPMLCQVFQEKWRDWTACYGTSQQRTPQFGGYHSECVFVPRDVVWTEIYRRYGGNPGRDS